jgi:pyrimidine-nucleoside phosphorylase
MNMLDIIAKKRDGYPLSRAEIEWFVDAVAHDRVPDYQTAALLMAIVLRGMDDDETVALTLAMAHSGQVLDLSSDIGYAVDKHSSGGVGDKTTLIVLPLVAACGVKVAKMSGRGLGLTGGTLDKLESIAGFDVNLTEAEFRRIARERGLVLAGQSGDLAPADGRLYALRDVTGTVQSIPLIVGSIMSKKIAAGAQGIVLDVKMGSGAFMKTLEDARTLAQSMVAIGTMAGRDMVATVSDMNEPLGAMVGNALEIRETIDILRGGGMWDLRKHCLDIAAHMLWLAGRGERWTDEQAVYAELEARLASGEALARFREMVAAQGGDVRMIDNPSLLPQAAYVETVTCAEAGYVAGVSAEGIARVAFDLGAGRVKKGEPVDFAVGVEVHVKVADHVTAGQPVLTIYANDRDKLADAKRVAEESVTWSASPTHRPPHTYDVFKARAR